MLLLIANRSPDGFHFLPTKPVRRRPLERRLTTGRIESAPPNYWNSRLEEIQRKVLVASTKSAVGSLSARPIGWGQSVQVATLRQQTH